MNIFLSFPPVSFLKLKKKPVFYSVMASFDLLPIVISIPGY